MLDQMQVTTPVHALSSSLTSSYAIGPIDPAQLLTLQAHLSEGLDISLPVPAHLPLSILTHPVFKGGYECSYLECDPGEVRTVPKLANEVYHILAELYDEYEPDFCPWMLGSCLGSWQTWQNGTRRSRS